MRVSEKNITKVPFECSKKLSQVGKIFETGKLRTSNNHCITNTMCSWNCFQSFSSCFQLQQFCTPCI